jgi:hypothetical protein
MKVKVYCPCGAKFEFEVEPVNERMPVSISCPVCGADATELANEVIQRQFAALQPADIPALAPAPASPPSGLRIARAVPAPAPPPETAAGHSPSPAAPRAVPQRAAPSASPVWQKHLSQDELNPWTRRAIQAAVAVLLLLGAAWFWYVWFARDPKVMYSLDFPKASGAGAFYELIAPGRLVSIKNQHVTLMDVTQQISLWSVPVPAASENSFAEPRVIATSNDVWVVWSGCLMRLDRQTGAQKQLSLPDPIIRVTAGDNMILVLAGNSPSNETVTGFSVSDGASQAENITLPSPPPVQPQTPAVPVVNNQPPGQEVPDDSERQERRERREHRESAEGNGAQAAGATIARVASVENSGHVPREEEEFLSRLGDENTPFFDAGANAVWFQPRLLEHRELTSEAMKKPSGKSVLDNPNLNASQGIELAEEMANNSQRERTGGVEIVDVSLYQVTLHRLFAHDVPDWTGEVTGPPKFVPLKTVDLVVAGTNLLVFDKNNKKIWDARLTFRAFPRDDLEAAGPPCLETSDALYFADEGMLTRFDLATGNVRWRLTSVGISAVHADDRGRIYVDTSNRRPESIKYSQQVNLRDTILRAIMRVDPASGSILWRSEFPGSSYRCFVSGKFLYSSRVWQTQDPLRLEEGPDTHFTFKLVQPANGKMIWNHVLDNKLLIKAEVQNNWILLQFEDQVSVMKFFSL